MLLKTNISTVATEERDQQLFIEDVENRTFSQFSLGDETLTVDSGEQTEHLNIQKENPLISPTCFTPLFSFNPNRFPYVLTYHSTVTMDGKKLVSLETNENDGFVDGASGIKIRTTVIYPTNVENNVDEVKEILMKGCLCLSNCFANMDPEYIYRQRVNMFNLDETEHNMFLMGTMLGCSLNCNSPKADAKYYLYGKHMCKDAFLYLLCCSQQQLSEVQYHFINYGIAPLECSIKKSENHSLFFEEGYKSIKEFLFKYVGKHLGKKSIYAGRYVRMPWGTTKKSLYETYGTYVHKRTPGKELMAYSTFTNFLLEYFPRIIFGGPAGDGSALPQVQHKGENEKIVAIGDVEAVSPFVAIPPHGHFVQCQNQDSLKVRDSFMPTARNTSLELSDTVASSSTKNK